MTVPVEGEDELAELGRSFNAMSSELERARESQRGFLESVSHELKTPLTSIRGYAEALEEDAVSPGDGGRIIAAEADRLERLVHDLVDLARFGRAGFDVERRELDLAAVGAAAVKRHLPRARELGVELRWAGGTGCPGVGDEGRLLQATSNLIENALRLTPAGGSVTVWASAGAITVADTGPGLAAEDVPRAFERFYLYERYRSERGVGSGLGLAIVQELVQRWAVTSRLRTGSAEARSSRSGYPRARRFGRRLARRPAASDERARQTTGRARPRGAPDHGARQTTGRARPRGAPDHGARQTTGRAPDHGARQTTGRAGDSRPRNNPVPQAGTARCDRCAPTLRLTR